MKAVSDKFIPHEGPEDADFFFIQDFPSSTDETIGRPFMGRGGGPIEEALSVFDIPRESVRLGSLLNYQPAANSFSKASGSWQLEDSRKYLTSYLSTAKHKVLIPLGSSSLDFLTSYSELDKRRGSVYNYKNFLVLPMQDPSITAIDGSRKPVLLKDLEKALHIAQYGWDEIKYKMHVDPDIYQIQSLLPRILSASRLYVDIETKMESTYIRCIGFAWEEEGQLIATCIYNDGNYVSNPVGATFRHILNQLLTSPIPKTFHNGMFDTLMLKANGFEVTNFDYDTMIAQHVLQPELPIGLDFCTSIYTYINYYKDDGKHSSDRIDRQKLGVYNCKDVIATALSEGTARRVR